MSDYAETKKRLREWGQEVQARAERAERERDEAYAALVTERKKHDATARHFNAAMDRLMGNNDELNRVNAAQRAALVRADALLRECEWKATAFVIGDDSKTYVAAACPICRRPQPDGHTLDCELAAYLRDREGGAQLVTLSRDVVTRLVQAAELVLHEHEDAKGLDSVWLAGVEAAIASAKKGGVA